MGRRIGALVAAIGLCLGATATSTAQVFNAGIPAGFTCNGSCGVSGANGVVPLAPAGGTQFGWISTSSGPAMDPLGILGTTNGTVLTSGTFAATFGQVLSFRFNYVTSDGGPFDDYAWVRLVGVGGPQILFTARTMPSGNTIPGQGLPGLAAGVTLTPATTPVIPGAPDFTPLDPSNNLCYDFGCGYTGWIRAAYAIPTAGNYQLEFGVVNLLDNLWDSSLAIDYALGVGSTPEIPENEDEHDPIHGTPEPSTWLLLATGFVGVGAVGRKRARRSPRGA